ncbi:cold shock and DUF1294 domain-containing protein [Conchiformibius steedae DSM 2580]|uniref:Cold shock and DUF1294 domain-containing protein n=1 Tax=Conchiformibius steedae DSM 2580 TaxID=1121352 RepID=A0AAE9HWH1_9NEIS|nr:DUF1294 domain-containing protein [Conchiformibius steedae]QMT33161.1 DUF1294 domain-containing protein [Conchiformibius steedae]URD67796.1 cold shock and DUF1294 domain-containing protein [Conchiformibius steedae DSM 2580]
MSNKQQYMGEIVRWQADRGFGFIHCRALGQDVFFHIRAYRVPNQTPAIGDKVAFVLGQSKNGKPQAEQVQEWAFVQKKQDRQRRHQKHQAEFVSGQKRNVAIVVTAYALLLAAVALGKLFWWVLVWYAVLGLLTFLSYWRDKQAALNGAWRTPENTLHLLSLLGGWPAALLAQTYLRHKSQKAEFRLVYFVSVFANIALLFYLAVKFKLQ